jgi:hypothetical protein
LRPQLRQAAISGTLWALLAFPLGACGGDNPAGASEAIPDIVGLYQGNWTYVLAYNPPDGDEDLVCPGTMAIASQTPNGTFTGAWTQLNSSEDCNEASGTLSGVVAPGGAITVVSLSSDGGGAGSTLEEVTGGECVATRFDDGYRGSAGGGSFEISYAISGECGQGRAVSWVTAFAGSSVSELPAGAP